MGNNTNKIVYPEGLLISKKAYKEFTEQLSTTFTLINDRFSGFEARKLFERYVTCEDSKSVRKAIDKCLSVVKGVLYTLIWDIDKAISRSKAARQRAAARKEKKLAEAAALNNPPNNPSDSTPANNAAPLSDRALEIEKQMNCEERVVNTHEVNGVPVRVIESPELAPEAYKFHYDAGCISESDYSSLLERAGVAAPASEAEADTSPADA